MELNVIDLAGNAVERIEVAPETVARFVNRDLLHQAVVAAQANKRAGTACTKGRGEKSGSNRKLFRQKGTGRARSGPLRTPVRRGGGKAFGPKPRDFRIDMPRRERRLAVRQAVLAKLRDDEIMVVSSFELAEPKTRLASEALNGIGVLGKKCLIVLPDHRPETWRAFRNIQRVGMTSVRELNVYDILLADVLLWERAAWEAFTATAESSQATES